MVVVEEVWEVVDEGVVGVEGVGVVVMVVVGGGLFLFARRRHLPYRIQIGLAFVGPLSVSTPGVWGFLGGELTGDRCGVVCGGSLLGGELTVSLSSSLRHFAFRNQFGLGRSGGNCDCGGGESAVSRLSFGAGPFVVP